MANLFLRFKMDDPAAMPLRGEADIKFTVRSPASLTPRKWGALKIAQTCNGFF